MSEGGTGRVLEERINALKARFDAYERRQASEIQVLKASQVRSDERLNEILTAIGILKTRVGFFAAGIGMAAGVGSSLAVVLIRTWVS